MVYRGRPSTGCGKCRERKIKCDERPYGCIKCETRGYTCPGYPESSTLYFRDESEHVKVRAIKSNAKAIARRDELYFQHHPQYGTGSKPATFDGSQPRTQITKPMSTNPEALGLEFFLLHFASGLEITTPDPLTSPSSSSSSNLNFDPLLQKAMIANGLASLSHLSHSPLLTHLSRTHYAQALHLTNLALSSPSSQATDSTFLTTMLLGSFEATTGCSSENSLVAWGKHVEGTAALVHLRGRGQFERRMGVRLFLEMASQIFMTRVGSGRVVDGWLVGMCEGLLRGLGEGDPVRRFYEAWMRYSDFRLKVLNRDISDLREVVRRAGELDREAEKVFECAGEAWRYEVVRKEGEGKEVFGEWYHVYRSYGAVQVWNWVRIIRIGYRDILRASILHGRARKIDPLFEGVRWDKRLEETEEVLKELQADILASVPQHLHDVSKTGGRWATRSGDDEKPKFLWSNFEEELDLSGDSTSAFASCHSSSSAAASPSPQSSSSSSCSSSASSPSPSAAQTPTSLPLFRNSSGYSLLWNIYICGAMPTASSNSRRYALDSLSRIVSLFGINQAKVLWGVLALKIKILIERQLRGAGEEELELPPRYMLRGPAIGEREAQTR